ncbi:MAG: hypothetical protein J6P28_03235 [Treponema sp.]|nr:hypothetical protein [Treponema sp.]
MTKKGLLDRLSQYPDDIPVKIGVGSVAKGDYYEFMLLDVQGMDYSKPEKRAVILAKKESA